MAKDRSDSERAERKARKAKAKAEKASAAAEEVGLIAKNEHQEKKRARSADDDEVEAPKKRKRDSDVHEQAKDDSENDEFTVDEKILVLPFAEPLADEKQTAKLLKGIRRAAKHGTLKRGVKEITKSARKSGGNVPGAYDHAPAVAILAGDVWPEDVISHIPVLCEDHSIPFIFVKSRKDMGEAGQTKRPTSCLLLLRDKPESKTDEGGKQDDATWNETFKSVHKLILNARNNCHW